MATVTAPIMTDATGQSIDSKLNSLLGKMDNLAAAFQPNASGIVYSNTTSGLTGDDVQEAIDEMAADVSEIKQSLSDLVQSITLSNQTTNSQGMIITNLNFDGKWISAYVSGGRYASFRPSGSDKLVIRLVNDNGEAVTNTSVNVTLYHIGAIS